MKIQNISIVLFDGVCNLCNYSVQLILKYDQKQYFYFAPLQSDVANTILLQVTNKIREKETIILWDKGKVYSESDAALRIAYHLGGFWYFTQILWIIPPFIRNSLYKYIATNRYKWFGKTETCMIPNEKIKSRFL